MAGWKKDHPQAHDRCHTCWNLTPVCRCAGARGHELTGFKSILDDALVQHHPFFNARPVWMQTEWPGVDAHPLMRWLDLVRQAAEQPGYDPVVEAESIVYFEGE